MLRLGRTALMEHLLTSFVGDDADFTAVGKVSLIEKDKARTYCLAFEKSCSTTNAGTRDAVLTRATVIDANPQRLFRPTSSV
jgi:hypothetical protein